MVDSSTVTECIARLKLYRDGLKEGSRDFKTFTKAMEMLRDMITKDIYAEGVRWLCRDKDTGRTEEIDGPLAEIIAAKYPNDYELMLKEYRYE